MSMSDIRIRRFDGHPHAWQGCIEPDDRRWQLCIDEHGAPHLFVRVWVTDEDGARVPGLLDIDQAIEPRICDLLDAEAGGPDATPEEAAEAMRELGEAGYRCPVPAK